MAQNLFISVKILDSGFSYLIKKALNLVRLYLACLSGPGDVPDHGGRPIHLDHVGLVLHDLVGGGDDGLEEAGRDRGVGEGGLDQVIDPLINEYQADQLAALGD